MLGSRFLQYGNSSKICVKLYSRRYQLKHAATYACVACTAVLTAATHLPCAAESCAAAAAGAPSKPASARAAMARRSTAAVRRRRSRAGAARSPPRRRRCRRRRHRRLRSRLHLDGAWGSPCHRREAAGRPGWRGGGELHRRVERPGQKGEAAGQHGRSDGRIEWRLPRHDGRPHDRLERERERHKVGPTGPRTVLKPAHPIENAFSMSCSRQHEEDKRLSTDQRPVCIKRVSTKVPRCSARAARDFATRARPRWRTWLLPLQTAARMKDSDEVLFLDPSVIFAAL